MPSFSRRSVGVLVLGLATAGSSRANAQSPATPIGAEGFAVERFYPSAPGGGWFVMDTLDLHGELGGAIRLEGGYARAPLRVASADGSQRVAVVSDQAFADVALAVTYDRYRWTLDVAAPLLIAGETGAVGAYTFSAPHTQATPPNLPGSSVDVGHNPDLLADPRIGFDALLAGDATSPLRLGAGAQLVFPNGDRADYDTDGTFRAMIRLLGAGEIGGFTFAGQLGVHVRPLDDSPTPGSPRGSELLYGFAAGRAFSIPDDHRSVIVGPEIYGATAFQSFLGSPSSLEGLLTARLEPPAEEDTQVRMKLGAGAGLRASFGAPEWRVVFGLEVMGRTKADRKPEKPPASNETGDGQRR